MITFLGWIVEVHRRSMGSWVATYGYRGSSFGYWVYRLLSGKKGVRLLGSFDNGVWILKCFYTKGGYVLGFRFIAVEVLGYWVPGFLVGRFWLLGHLCEEQYVYIYLRTSTYV